MSFSQSGLIGRRNVVEAVNNVSLDIYENEILSLVGESGSGKTTIARCILKLMKPTSGTIQFNGTEITHLRGKSLRKYRKDVQIIFQDPYESLNPRQDVYTAVSLPIRELTQEKNTTVIENRVFSLLEEVGLDPGDVAKKLPHQLSGGERQRVNIARALAPDPTLLVADEPITMLDAAQRVTVLSLLMQLKLKRKLTVLMITHDLASAKLTSNGIIVMYRGKIVEVGNTANVLATPHHPYVELIMSSAPVLHLYSLDSVKQQESPVPVTGEKERISNMNSGGGCIFLAKCKYASDICRETDPILEEKSDSHSAACHNPMNVKAS